MSSHTRAHPEDSIQAFREGGKAWRPPIPRREKWVVAVVGLILVFTGWGLGGMRVWTQVVLGLLGFLALAVTVFPGRDLSLRPAGETPWHRLRRFPVFWLGGLLLLYVICQQLNPSWEYIREGTRWRLVRLDYIGWLPSGMITPFIPMNGWRCLIWMGGAWMAVCAVWAGIQYRRSILFLLWLTVCSAALMVVVGVWVRFSGERELLGLFDSRGARSFFGSFYYANHAGAYLLIHFGFCLGLALYSWSQARVTGKKSNPGFFLVMLSLVILVGVYFTESRASILFSLGLAGMAGIVATVEMGRIGDLSRSKVVIFSILMAIVTSFGILLFSQVDLEKINRELEKVVRSVVDLSRYEEEREARDSSVEARLLFARATLDMWEERKWYGFGLGSYQYYIPVHQKNYPEIYYHPWNNRSPEWKERRGFPPDAELTRKLRYAHTDWLQGLAEMGLVGTGIVVVALLSWALLFLKRVRYWNPGVPILLGGFFFVLCYAAFEFIFWSPSVTMSFSLIPVMAYKTLKQSRR